jgi:hypothetical protein
MYLWRRWEQTRSLLRGCIQDHVCGVVSRDATRGWGLLGHLQTAFSQPTGKRRTGTFGHGRFSDDERKLGGRNVRLQCGILEKPFRWRCGKQKKGDTTQSYQGILMPESPGLLLEMQMLQ